MFIETTDLQNKKHLINVTYIVSVINNNSKDEWEPNTQIEYHNDTLFVKESYQYIKNCIDKAIKNIKDIK